MSIKDLTGLRFNRLVVLSRNGSNKKGNAMWICHCDCGKDTLVASSNLLTENTKSCGCHNIDATRKRSTTHGNRIGGHVSSEYSTWCSMKARCFNPKTKYYKYYGGKGISVCDEWLDFQTFLDDMGKKPNMDFSVERRDNTKNYCKENCYWATPLQQGRNNSGNKSIEYNGRIYKTISELCDALKLPYTTVYCRIRRGWSKDRLGFSRLAAVKEGER